MVSHETNGERRNRQLRERVFDAPRDRVFAVYTDPQLIPEWWGPRDTTAVVDRMDVRAGGSWRFVMRNSDGSETGFRGTYREVTPPERIVQTFEWEGMPGHVSVETATFEDLGDRTKVTTTSIFHTPEERDGMLASGMERGMNETYARLDELLARLAARRRALASPASRGGGHEVPSTRVSRRHDLMAPGPGWSSTLPGVSMTLLISRRRDPALVGLLRRRTRPRRATPP
jgi:uncharacterized protein YndB with AHSA1/START domain